MSEKIYGWLLRLLLPRFYAAYGDAALQLFRDRSRDERGFGGRVRLWMDLAADLGASVCREHRFAQRAVIGTQAQTHSDGIPTFAAVEGAPPRVIALLLGGVLSVVAFGPFPALITHAENYRLLGREDGGATLSSLGMSAFPAGAMFEDVPLDAAERKRVIAGVISNLKEYYVYPDLAQKMADALAAHERAGDDNAEMDGAAFADLLTKQLQDVSHDRHLRVFYSAFKAPEHAPGPQDDAEFRKELERDNCAFKRVEILAHNVGYLKFNAFPPPQLCQATAVNAMGFLAHADAVIFDLRDNHGGDPNMVAFIATYLFDRRTHLNDIYNRQENSTQQFWTLADVPGKKLADKPAYVLTSSETFSGAEEFCYDLKNLKRATLVGEATGGGAHLVGGHRIDDHFAIGVPFARAINPISKTDWEGTGVQPDVKVRAADALATAEKLAESKLGER